MLEIGFEPKCNGGRILHVFHRYIFKATFKFLPLNPLTKTYQPFIFFLADAYPSFHLPALHGLLIIRLSCSPDYFKQGTQTFIWVRSTMLTDFYITVFILYDCAVFRFVPPSVTDFIRNIIKEVSEHRTSDKVTRNDLFNHFMKKTAGLCLLQDTRIITRYISYYLFLATCLFLYKFRQNIVFPFQEARRRVRVWFA